MSKAKLVTGYALIGVAILCLILMLALWFYMIWTPDHDTRLEDTQPFLAFLGWGTGTCGVMMVIK